MVNLSTTGQVWSELNKAIDNKDLQTFTVAAQNNSVAKQILVFFDKQIKGLKINTNNYSLTVIPTEFTSDQIQDLYKLIEVLINKYSKSTIDSSININFEFDKTQKNIYKNWDKKIYITLSLSNVKNYPEVQDYLTKYNLKPEVPIIIGTFPYVSSIIRCLFLKIFNFSNLSGTVIKLLPAHRNKNRIILQFKYKTIYEEISSDLSIF